MHFFFKIFLKNYPPQDCEQFFCDSNDGISKKKIAWCPYNIYIYKIKILNFILVILHYLETGDFVYEIQWGPFLHLKNDENGAKKGPFKKTGP